jgi:hypothetical protein
MRTKFNGCVHFKVDGEEYESEVSGTVYDCIYGDNIDCRMGEARSCIEFFIKSITKLPYERLSSDKFIEFEDTIEKMLWKELANV